MEIIWKNIELEKTVKEFEDIYTYLQNKYSFSDSFLFKMAIKIQTNNITKEAIKLSRQNVEYVKSLNG